MSPLRRQVRRPFNDYERPLGPAKLYLDDLDDLVEDLRTVVEEKQQATQIPLPKDAPAALRARQKDLYRVRLRAGGADADDVEDLKSASKKDIRHVTISTFQPDITIRLWRNPARVSATIKAEDADLRSFVDDIARYVKGRQVPIVWRHPIVPICIFILLSSSVGIWSGIQTDNGLLQFLAVAVNGIFALFALLAPFIMQRRLGSVIVIQERRSESRGFSRQTRRDLIVGLTGVLVGAFLATIGQLVVELVVERLK